MFRTAVSGFDVAAGRPRKVPAAGIRSKTVPRWSPTLPRLGSRVRIPSPAPNFLKEISFLERSFGAVFCFPASLCETGEAWGKQQEEDRSGRAATFGIRKASNVPSRATPGNGVRSPDNLPRAGCACFPEMTVAFSIRFPDCLLRFFAKDTDMIIQVLHQMARQHTRRNEFGSRTVPYAILSAASSMR